MHTDTGLPMQNLNCQVPKHYDGITLITHTLTINAGMQSYDKTPSSACQLFLGGAHLYQKTVAYSQLPPDEHNVNSTAQVANQS